MSAFYPNIPASQRGPAIGRDGIALVELRGPITKGGPVVSAAAVHDELRALAKRSDVRGIMLLIDSPGGELAGAMDLAAAIRTGRSQKHIHAYIEDRGVCVGYLIAASAAYVSANRSAVIGGIGTCTVLVDSSKAAEKAGAKVNVIRTGRFKGIGTPGTPIDEEQGDDAQRVVDEMNAVVVDAIARGRRVPSATAAKWADGRLHIGRHAAALKLVDSIETFDEAMQRLRVKAGAS